MVCFPFGRPVAKPNDKLKQQVAQWIMMENPFREQLKAHVYYNVREDDVNGRLNLPLKCCYRLNRFGTDLKS